MQGLLTPEHENIIREERLMLEQILILLGRMEASKEDITRLQSSVNQIDNLFLLVVVGEFNAGKSTFLNALLGDHYLDEGVTPTTDHIHVLRYGETLQKKALEDELLEIQIPVEWLNEINLVDTPGTNAVIQRHQEITQEFVPRSDLVLFVTSVDRPFSESERRFLEGIRKWGKKIVIAVNKIDMIPNASDRQEIVDFVHENAEKLLGVDPTIFPVSARLALQAKQTGRNKPTDEHWIESRFGTLESYILESLDDQEKLRLKLENPMGIANRLLDQYEGTLEQRHELLSDDFQTVDVIDEQLGAYEADMRQDFKYHKSHVDNVLYAMMERGDTFLDETIQLRRVLELTNSERLRGEFERKVVGETSREIETHVSELIDWIVERNYRQWNDITNYLKERSQKHAEKMVGKVGGEFEINRRELLESVGRESQRVIDSYDREAEAQKLANEVQQSLIQTAALEIGAIGLGALLVGLLETALLDFTGILGASLVAALGFYILPYRRTKAKMELRERIGEIRKNLHNVLTKEFEQELQAGTQRIREAISPYTRFLNVEREKMTKQAEDIQTSKDEIGRMRAIVAELGE